MLKQEIQSIVNLLTSKELPPWERGSVQQEDRMRAVATMAAHKFPGSFVEIGCMCGATTSMMAQIAREFDRRVIACDPWTEGVPNWNPVNYGKFVENTKKWKDIIDVLRMLSEDERAIKYIKGREICFAYVDGDHTVEHCLRDIQTVIHAPIICVDDAWSSEIVSAMNKSGREILFSPLCKEAYLL